jgi:hypothetical protein
MVRLDLVWFNCAEWYDKAQTSVPSIAWRDDHHMPPLHHLGRPAVEVANQHSAAFWMEIDRHVSLLWRDREGETSGESNSKRAKSLIY